MHRTQKRPGPISARWKGPRDWWDTQSDPFLSLTLSLFLSLFLCFCPSLHIASTFTNTPFASNPCLSLSLCPCHVVEIEIKRPQNNFLHYFRMRRPIKWAIMPGTPHCHESFKRCIQPWAALVQRRVPKRWKRRSSTLLITIQVNIRNEPGKNCTEIRNGTVKSH